MDGGLELVAARACIGGWTFDTTAIGGDVVMCTKDLTAFTPARDPPCAFNISLDLPEVTVIGGALRAGDVCPGDLRTDVSADVFEVKVPKLVAIFGDYEIVGSTVLDHLDDRNLIYVGGDLTITDNAGLTTLNLPALATIGGSLQIDRNPQLADLGLGALTTVGVKGTSIHAPALPDCQLDGLRALGLIGQIVGGPACP
jgi:hypothetical protein